MARITRTTRISACALGLAMLAGTAYAGPQITFGPDDIASLQIDYKGQFQLMYQDTGSGPNGTNDTVDFNFRRNRLALRGAYGENFSLYVQTEYAQNPVTNPLRGTTTTGDAKFIMLDAVMRFKYDEMLQFNVGKYKYNFTREVLDACEAPTTMDRSLFLTSPFVTDNSIRDLGVTVWGNFMEGMFQYRADIMQGRTNSYNGVVSPSSSFRYDFRGHVSLFDKEDSYGYKGTYLGEKKVLTFGAGVQYEPRIAYSDTVTQSGVVNYFGYTFDGFYEQKFNEIGTVTVGAAYANYDLADAYLGANPDPGTMGFYGQRNGGYVKAAYLMPTMPLQFFGRYENWSYGWLNGIFNQKVDWYGIGARYYFRGQNLNLAIEYSRTNFDKHTSSDPTYANFNQDYNTVLTQLQVIF